MRRNLILLLALLVFLFSGNGFTAFGATINPGDYWVLEDGYSALFSSGKTLKVTGTAGGNRFNVNFMGTGTWTQGYDASGNLLMYGATTSGGSRFDVVNPQNAVLLPSRMVVGETHKVSWQRNEHGGGAYQGSDSVAVTVSGPETVTVPAGTYTAYKFVVVDIWADSWGQSGTTKSTFWLAQGIGWVKVMRRGVTYELQEHEGGPPSAPRLSVSTSGVTLSLAWPALANADGYTLFYAPYPQADPIGSLAMGTQMGGSFNLFEGAAYYLAVRAYNSFGRSGYSNIEYFIIGYSLSVTPSSLSLSVGQTGSCAISDGTGPCSATSSNTSVVTVGVSGSSIYVTGAYPGSATITVRDSDSDSATVSVNVSGDILTIDTGGADLDSDGVIDIRYVSKDFGGAPGPFFAAEGGFQCGVGSGNRLSSPRFVNVRYCTEYPEAYDDVIKAPDYVPGSDSEGTYFTYFGPNLSETLVARSYSGNRYFKILFTRVDEVECEFIWKEIDPPLAETCTPGTAGLNELGLFCIPPP